ncbi:MAG: hypothetical protein LBV43_11585 [Prevotella sp.]|jgi:hypothetical protein|nr:hypothetical protein [Prevotella sp.]
MRKFCFLIITVLFIGGISCTSKSYDLERMGEQVKQHLRYRDTENETITKITYIKALSYEKIPESERANSEEEYLCKVYMRGTWSYYNSYRIFNIDDTIDCYFNKNKAFIRMGNLKEQ